MDNGEFSVVSEMIALKIIGGDMKIVFNLNSSPDDVS